tara:strand:+ start:465 stop:719 length:255 start_codon:yes stop_codon:yes gene_type:complete
MQKARNTHDIVLTVNIDSSRYHQVIMGNVKYENTAATNLEVQSSGEASIENLVPYQNRMLQGIPNIKIGKRTLSFQNSLTNCRL